MRHHLIGGGHLEVERAAHRLAQHAHVAVLDVPAILAQVDGDAVGARELAQRSRPHRVGVARAACLPQRRDVVDVHVELHGYMQAGFGTQSSKSVSSSMQQSAVGSQLRKHGPVSEQSHMLLPIDMSGALAHAV